MEINGNVIAAGLRELALFFDENPTAKRDALTAAVAAAADTLTAAAQPTAAPAPAKRGRGRPVAGESSGPTTTAPAPAPAATAPVETDPFAAPAPAAPAAPTATLDEVRAALTALKAATTQDNALSVLKSAGGADNLTQLKPDFYGNVVSQCKTLLSSVSKPAVEDDPFAVPATTPALAAKPLTKEELRELIIKTQKRTGAETVMKLVMDHGGFAADPNGGKKANFQALPESAYATVAAALKALPSTK